MRFDDTASELFAGTCVPRAILSTSVKQKHRYCGMTSPQLSRDRAHAILDFTAREMRVIIVLQDLLYHRSVAG